MICTQILMDEHQVILRRLVSLANTLEEPLAHTTDVIEQDLKFIREYADKLHHTKEEEIYFPWMLTQDPALADGGPIGCMLKEHDRGRDMIERASNALAAFQQSSEPGEEDILKENLGAFIHLLVEHIEKEDNVLYQIAERLNESAQSGDASMLESFEKVNAELKTIADQAEAFEQALRNEEPAWASQSTN